MAVLEHLEPGRVFHFFEQMSAIPAVRATPRPSATGWRSLPGRGACGISRMR